MGGQVVDGTYHAQQAVQLVEQFLSGTPITEIQPLIKSENKWIFDAVELERAGIDKAKLPEGSVLINEVPSFYEQYKVLVWLTLAGCLAGMVTIFSLSNAIRLQQVAEQRLKEHEKELEQRVLDRTAELSDTLAELRNTQAQLVQTERLSSLGQLVGGIAHEFNNPLSFIYSNLKHLQSYIESLLNLLALYQDPTVHRADIEAEIEEVDLAYIQEDAPKLIESAQRGTKRIQAIVSTLQNFSRADQEGIKQTDINQSLDSTLLMLNHQLREGITVVKDYGNLPLVSCQPGDLNQVFMNILLNAIYAVEKRPYKKITIRTLLLDNQKVQIAIEDNGSGVPLEVQEKVFDPFFTTKPVGEGTGLGLALSYQTVQQHQGNIKLRSTPDHGTTLLIELPVKEASKLNSVAKPMAIDKAA